MKQKYIIGVDEAGRGAWAGPVSVGSFLVPLDFDFSLLPGLTDSKKLTQKKREILLTQIEKLREEGKCYYAYRESSADIIDAVGIREANRRAMEQAIIELLALIQLESISEIQIDGRDNYHFVGIPDEKIRFIIRGDSTEMVISAASIVAKVKRDRKMCDFSEEYPKYGFSLHKGYGTRKHHDALLSYGIQEIHRKSYTPVKALISVKA